MSSVADIREAALWAARRGWAVFPTRPGGKEPRPGLSWPNAATADPALVARARWQPGEGYGIAAKASGLVILDLDQPKPGYRLPEAWRDEPGIRNGWDVLAALAERAGVTSWPATFTVTTPSGGAHLYYLAPGGRPIGNRPAGPLLDVRGGGDGNGGYVLGPGTVLNGKAYEITDDQDPQPLPGWIADLLDPPKDTTVRLQQQTGRYRGPSAYADHALVSELARICDAPEGTRNNELNRAAFSLGQLVGGGLLDLTPVEAALVAAGERAGLDPGETALTVKSGLGKGMAQPRRLETVR